ncbi:MAG: hypothetical protein NZM31_05210 [Gemmatales bacterium]|nr:hypothetical protein [Gemmatales bacterium]MDW8386396.1 hypothetical protein [Gemmatales bacterium]
MFRTTLVALVTLAGLSLPAVADANPFWDGIFGGHRHHHHGFFPPIGPRPPGLIAPRVVHYRVLYRDCFCSTWSCYGVYCDPWQANLIAQQLRCQGFIVRVVPC